MKPCRHAHAVALACLLAGGIGCSSSENVQVDGEVPVGDGSTPDVTAPASDAPSPDIARSDGGGDALAENVCSAVVGRAGRCNKTPPPAMVQCGPLVTSTLNRFRREALEAFQTCHESLPCDQSDDNCVEAMLKAVTDDFLNEPTFLRCSSARKGCQAASEPTYSDDACLFTVVLNDEVQAALDKCYERPCAEMKGCVEALMPSDFD